jgi:hypothetical protein
VLKFTRNTLLGTVAFAAFAIGAIGIAAADDPSPTANPPPAGRHHNPAWAACKQQADEQKIAAGDARRDFMKNCMKSAERAGTPPATS